jgi:hypothetical protein
MEGSNIRFDINIPEELPFGPEKDLYCRKMFEKALSCGENINGWNMWKRVSDNIVVCKYCRLSGNNEVKRHECGWWENVQNIQGNICFCFCHDVLGYALTDGDSFLISDWPSLKDMLLADWDECGECFERVNDMRIDYMSGIPPNYIKYFAHRDDEFVISDDDTGKLRPSQILSIQAFSMFRRPYEVYTKKVLVYRHTALGQFATMQSKRYFQRCSKSLWTLRDDKAIAMMVQLHEECMRAAMRSQERVITVISKHKDTLN